MVNLTTTNTNYFYLSPKYVTPEGATVSQQVLKADLPSFVISKGKLDSSVLMQLAIDKFWIISFSAAKVGSLIKEFMVVS